GFFVKENKFIGAICGAITVLSKSKILDNKNFTCHSSVIDKINAKNYKKNIDKIIDGNLITSPGAGRSIDFSFALASVLVSEEKINEVKKGMELI
ncbi:MAG: DJ-1/PfpI family protein, partial [Fusobacteriaceae bacterium]